ncbi:unnamed protein product [Brachionus calyciflorus]|uniref:Sugar phosphate transporter domain-containing protein n=1 Tax=Brachionus calyciflorus TaxID=104777 RepID=A0A814KVD7_9BILA|nr:unnamed protein product [Brachionus calyciflorus]
MFSKLVNNSESDDGDTDDITLQSKKNPNKLKYITLSLLTILIYYFFSISLTFYNRHLFVTYKYPLSITIIHLILKFVLSALIRHLLNLIEYIRKGPNYKKRVLLNWNLFSTRIIPNSLASAADIGLSNWSLQYITITLYTMSKSTVILFIFFFSIIFKLEKWRRSIIGVILCIAFGLFLFTYHSTEFHLFGFSLVLIASFMAGLRWTLAQAITQKHEIGLANPIDMIYHVQPFMILCLLPLALYVEGVPIVTTDKFFRSDDYSEISKNVLWIILGALLGFLLEASELLVVTFTSSLTLSISGIFKEICIVYLAVTLNHNKLNPMNTTGLVICLIGISIHCVIKARNETRPMKTDKVKTIRRKKSPNRKGNYTKLENTSDNEDNFMMDSRDGESIQLR